MTEKTYLSLSELNGLIRATLEDSFPDLYWVVAEIASLRDNRHCYLDLVEKRDDSPVAQMRATIWSSEYKRIAPAFERVTGETLKKGMTVMFLCSISFHEVYGLSLNIQEIDPRYTIGEMARKKQEVIERLKKEGLIELNKAVPLPLVIQRIAVISSAGAAGYGDFSDQLDKNPHGYTFRHVLFTALMQGEKAEESILSALDKIRFTQREFEVVVIIRGGGSDVDLSCFDSFGLGSAIARFPLPILSGIGHHRDESVADMVSHASLKTPTAVAEYIVGMAREFEERVEGALGDLSKQVEYLVSNENHRLGHLIKDFSYGARGLIDSAGERFAVDIGHLRSSARELITRCQGVVALYAGTVRYRPFMVLAGHKGKIDVKEQAVRHLDPENVLRRGYSITMHKGKPLRDVAELKVADQLLTRLNRAMITSRVENIKEEDIGQEGTDLRNGN